MYKFISSDIPYSKGNAVGLFFFFNAKYVFPCLHKQSFGFAASDRLAEVSVKLRDRYIRCEKRADRLSMPTHPPIQGHRVTVHALRMSGTIPLFPRRSSWRAQVHLYLYVI